MNFMGIDLAGSENRNTGICVMDSSFRIIHLSVKHTDEEIINIVERCKPKIIAIDAPLSLPKGRKDIDINNGIHFRKCDLELRRMRIKFFPITLGPMRMLTKRGMRLKMTLEKMKYKVIETFPGAVQDILGIPRKTKGIEKLRSGLIEFGIKNIPENATHDELDAITCAIIAKYYHDGTYLEIGDPDEGTIILPKS
ncbi:MAG: DUF429 domain-containing protein [Candidatus Aenigmarchaeota archaeon]|nr:DUF429 domain-containing protein [Candidatus Aenigmarchaeota archaeon]